MATLLGKPLLQPEDPGAPPPELSYALADQMQGGPTAPMVRMPSVQPNVSGPDEQQQQINHDQAQLQKIHWHQEHPSGTAENHPGVAGRIAHVLSVAGNIAGNIVAPNVMANIPGTQLGMQEQESGLAKRLNDEVGDESTNQARNAMTAKTEQETATAPAESASKQALQKAQTENLASETEMGNNPPPQYEIHDTAAGPLFVNKKTGQAQHLSVDGTPIGPKLQTKVVQLEMGGKPHQVLVDDATGVPIKDMGETGEKPPVFNANAGLITLDRESARLAKPYEKGISDANAQLDKIADARTMINGSAEAQALGVPKVLTALVSGAGSGVRITQPELNAIAKARGIAGDVQGTLQSWAGKGKLTPEQQKQLTGILDDVHARILQKQSIHNETLDRINGAASREEIINADKEARQKLSALEQGQHSAGGQMMRARDPNGVLHEAPSGTPLPAGWKVE